MDMIIKNIKTFYRPGNTIDKKITGWVFPQCQKYLKGMDSAVDTPRGVYQVQHLINSGLTFPKYKPLLSGLQLAKSAKPTDFLSSSYFRYSLLSKKAIGCLSGLNVGTHKAYPVRIYVRNQPVLYFFVGIIPMKQADYIHWDKCRFYETKLALKSADLDSIYDKKLDTEVPVFRSVDNYDAFCALHDLQVEEIAVNASFPMELDCVKFYNSFSPIFVSEKFVNTAIANGLTGLDFEKKIKIVQYV